MTRALVIGYGSIGSRHARVLQDLGLDVAVVSRRDITVSRRYASIGEALEHGQPDYVVIASQTHEHGDNLSLVLSSGFTGPIMVEKPLFTAPGQKPVSDSSRVVVGYNLRFHPVVRALRAALTGKEIYSVHAHVGQYLPDWRPDTDYRQSYSASRERGGGVLRDLSHELDYLTWICGGWSCVTATGGHVSSLEIDSDDVFSLMLATPECPNVTLNLNYLDTHLRREVHVLTSAGTVRADLVAGTVSADGETSTFTQERNDTYIAEHQAVLENRDPDLLCSYDEGLSIVELIAAAEKAAIEKKWIGREGTPL